jgi:hypothetical protein
VMRRASAAVGDCWRFSREAALVGGSGERCSPHTASAGGSGATCASTSHAWLQSHLIDHQTRLITRVDATGRLLV